MYRLSAATIATGSPTWRTRSSATQRCSTGGLAKHGIAPVTLATSSPVMTAATPGRAWARLTSIDLMRAWACGLRRAAAWSILGSATSSM
jgi:hypothetical protein